MPAKTPLLAALIALGSVVAVATTGTVAIVDRGSEQAISASPQAPAANAFVASIETQWLSPANARHSLDERSAELAEWSNVRGATLRVVSSTNFVRTHARDGARLIAPLARFERVFEIRVPGEFDATELQRVLADPDVTVGIANPDIQ